MFNELFQVLQTLLERSLPFAVAQHALCTSHAQQIRKYKVIKTPLSVYKSTAGREKYRCVLGALQVRLAYPHPGVVCHPFINLIQRC